MKTDSLFYRLFQTLPDLLFELIDQVPAQATAYRFTSVELKETTFRLDGSSVSSTAGSRACRAGRSGAGAASIG